MKKSFMAFGLFLLIALAIQLQAQIPRTLSYQGILTDNAGKPRPDGDYQFSFSLYDTAASGAPIWTEQKTLPVKNGLFSTILGNAIPFGAAVKFDKQYWLGIQVENEAELSPRISLTSVGYSLSAVRADTAKVAIASPADTTWKHDGANIYRLNGNVGIGTSNPQTTIDVIGNDYPIVRVTSNGLFGVSTGFSLVRSGDDGWHIGTGSNDFGGRGAIGFCTFSGNTWMVIKNDGKIGLGTYATEPLCRLHISDSVSTQFRITCKGEFGEVAAVQVEQSNVCWSIGTGASDFGGYGSLGFRVSSEGNNNTRMVLTSAGNLGIGTNTPQYPLDVNGRIRTSVLEITGGSDLAEPFEISHADSLPVGSLVVIDPEQPGKLKQATEPYDKRVAGVISGAGGINPGLTLTQEGKLTGSQHVALTGKVYALATAANGAIEPGDLLTTSSISGHAMKAMDQSLAFGSIIGKAMSGLKNGEGLVLVLIQPH